MPRPVVSGLADSRPMAAADWFDRFFAAYYRRRPVNATFIGIHHYDDTLPDFSDRGVAETVTEMAALLRDSALVETADLTPIERLDLRVALGFLTTQLWEFGSHHFHRGNPSLYTGEAIFGVFALLLTDFAPRHARLELAAARLARIPRLLDQARDQVRAAPRPWIDRAIRECKAALAFLAEGVPTIADRPESFDQAAKQAGAAFERYRDHLFTELGPRGTTRLAAGEEALALHLREAHFVTEPAEEIARLAESLLEEADARLAAAPRAGAPDRAGSLTRYQELWTEAHQRATDAGLLTWPEFPIRYQHRPAWATAAAPDLYFLNYRSPAAFNRPAVTEYLVPDADPGERAIKLNHVVHHGGIGHHVQNWYAFRSESRIGRIAAVDCASRIAMLAGGTMAEGWACYATDLMDEIGFLTASERIDEIQTRRRMCARAVVDIRLHSGRISFEQAVDYYRTRAGMSLENATAEATKNSMFPGGAVIYLLGQEAIHQLRRDLSARAGAAFELARFHDRFLSFGSLPVRLIAEAMRAEAETTA